MTTAFDLDAKIVAVETALEWMDKAPSTDWRWTLKRLADYARALRSLSPLQPGFRVVMIEPPNITEKVSPGWMGSKHFIIAGAKATVHEIDWSGGFTCGVVFDDESYIYEGQVRPVDRKHIFHMEQRRFKLMGEAAKTQAGEGK